MPREQFKLSLKESYFITPNVKHLLFQRSDNLPFTFTPGQFINFHFQHNDKECQRSYSIATRDLSSGFLEIAVSEVKDGPGTQFLFSLQPNDTVLASGPFGKFILREDEHIKRYLLVATSTGIAPYRSMLTRLSERLKTSPLHLVILLGVKTPEDLLYGEELARFAQEHPQTQFFACYSRKEPEEKKSFEYSGRVQTLLPTLHPDPIQDIVYLCGNPSMVDEAFALLKEQGFDLSNVRREKYV